MEIKPAPINNLTQALLLDFYGQLLTEKTLEIARLHYDEDMSLSEISELMGISRQAVHDSIKRANTSLADFEDKLMLAGMFIKQKRAISDALADIEIGDYESAKNRLIELTEMI